MKLQDQSRQYPWKLFGVLFAAGMLGVVGATPLLLSFLGSVSQQMQMDVPLPLSLLLLISYSQNAVLVALAVGLGLVLARKLDLGALWLEGKLTTSRERSSVHLPEILGAGLMAGFGVGIVLLLLLLFVFLPLVPQQPFTMAAHAALWKRMLVCFYGGLTEEILTRLFLFSLLAWLLSLVWHKRVGRPPQWILWTTNVVIALIFGLGHLPSASMLMTITPAAVAEAILLNGIAALTFGYLYWTRGLEAAMIAHFTADVVLYVIGPFLIRG